MSRRPPRSGRLSQSPRQGGWAPNLTPRAAVRIAALGGIVVAMLGLLLVRLWFLQIISGEDYAARAQGNHLRTVVVEAPRGNILDRNGEVLVANKAGKSVVARPSELRGDARARILGRLAKRVSLVDPAAQVTREDLMAAVKQAEDSGQPTAVLVDNASPDVIRYMSERWRDYPGVSLENTWVRTYPEGNLAAQILGSTGKITSEQLKEYEAKGYQGNETIGVGGLEQEYEQYLRGEPGQSVYEVDASGEPRASAPVTSDLPRQGSDVRTTIDIRVQRQLEAALARYAQGGSGKAAGVAIDPRTGDVIALGSYPSFNPQVFVDRRDKAIARIQNDPRQPQFNRATQGLYPAASTFKVVTASAALRAGLITPDTQLDSPSEVEIYDTWFPNFKKISHGMVNLPRALEVSSDTFFYQLGEDFYNGQGSPLQAEAERFGFGSRTGIDLPGESPGLVPTIAWKKKNWAGPEFSDLDRSWKPGDTVNLSVGQGNLQVTPLQLANAYAAIANGGEVMTPSLGLSLQEPNGRRVRDLARAKPTRSLDIADSSLQGIREGLYLAANGIEGTGAGVFGNLPGGIEIAGKTGTAENPGEDDHSWFVGYGPVADPTIVVAVVVENAGTGSNAAAPAVCATMASALDFPADGCGSAAEAN